MTRIASDVSDVPHEVRMRVLFWAAGRAIDEFPSDYGNLEVRDVVRLWLLALGNEERLHVADED